MADEKEICPVCRQRAEVSIDAEWVRVKCSRCRTFSLDVALLPKVAELESPSLAALSAATFQASEAGGSLVLDQATLSHEIDVRTSLSLADKLAQVLRIARRRSAHFGANMTLQTDAEFLLFDAANPEEAWALVDQLRRDGLLTDSMVDQFYVGSLTRKGWESADRQASDDVRRSALMAEAEIFGSRSFRVAFSFPGEARSRIGPIATILEKRLGNGSVFYDAWYKAELARPNLDLHLQGPYTRAQLVVVCLCGAYEAKSWCGLEWRAIREIIKQRDDRIMFLRLDDAPVSGTFSHDGYVDLRTHTDEQAATLIQRRVVPYHDTGAAPAIVSDASHTVAVAAQSEGSTTPDAADLVIEINAVRGGFAALLRNEGIHPIADCRILLTRLDRYLPQKREFARNPFEPMTVLNTRTIAGGETSHGFVFATWDAAFQSINFQPAIPEPRQSARPKLTSDDTLIAEFCLYQQTTLLGRQAVFIKAARGQTPALTSDPRSETLPALLPHALAHLKGRRIRLTPVLPIICAHDEYLVRNVTQDAMEIEKSSGHVITIPARRVIDDLPLSGQSDGLRLVELDGRLQWLSLSRTWRFFPEKPRSSEERQYGFFRAASPSDPIIARLQERGQKVRFARPDNLPRNFDEGHQLVYDEAGLFLKHGDLILIALGV